MFSIGDVRNPERPFFIRNQQVVGIGEALLIFPLVNSKSLFQSSYSSAGPNSCPKKLRHAVTTALQNKLSESLSKNYLKHFLKNQELI